MSAPLVQFNGCGAGRRYRVRPTAELTHAERQRATLLLCKMHDAATRALARPLLDAAVFGALREDATELLRIIVPDIEPEVIDQMSAGDCVTVYKELVDCG